MRTNGTAVCWGLNGGRTDAPGGYFTSVYAGHYHSCGLIDGERVSCWGSDLYGALQGKRVRALAVGGLATCAIRMDGTLECAGEPGNPSAQARPPGGQFVQIDLGWNHGCGVRPGGAIECWGANDAGQATPPE